MNHRQLAPHKTASVDTYRTYTNAVRFEADGSIVATDGSVLAIVAGDIELE